MYCERCGALWPEDAELCPKCGAKQSETAQDAGLPKGPRPGFSTRINDPAFARYVRHAHSWSTLFSVMLAAVAIAGFYIYGETSSAMGNPEALYVGFVIAGMFLLIGFYAVADRNRTKTWDGTVIDKRIQRKVKKKTGWDEIKYDTYTVYSVVIRDDRGKEHVVTYRDDDTMYNYYRIGDRVRHHGKLRSIEKYDKSGDLFIPCGACGTLCPIDEDFCHRCKCPLLK